MLNAIVVIITQISQMIALTTLIPSHANCIHHVLRCWERQPDGTEYNKKPFGDRGS